MLELLLREINGKIDLRERILVKPDMNFVDLADSSFNTNFAFAPMINSSRWRDWQTTNSRKFRLAQKAFHPTRYFQKYKVG